MGGRGMGSDHFAVCHTSVVVTFKEYVNIGGEVKPNLGKELLTLGARKGYIPTQSRKILWRNGIGDIPYLNIVHGVRAPVVQKLDLKHQFIYAPWHVEEPEFPRREGRLPGVSKPLLDRMTVKSRIMRGTRSLGQHYFRPPDVLPRLPNLG